MLKRKTIVKNCILAIVFAFLIIVGGTYIYAKMKPDTKISFGMYGDMVFRIDDEICDREEVMILILEKKKLYDELYGTDIWEKNIEGISAKEYLKYEVINELAKYKCVKLLAKDKKILLSNTEKSRAKKYAQIYIKQYSESTVSKYGISERAARTIYEDKLLFDKVFDSLTTTVNKEISVDEARVIKIQYIFVPIKTENAYNVAKDFLEQVNAGNNFEKLASDNNPDGVYECQLSRGQVEDVFEDAAFDLNSGENSEIVTTDKGYYIIKCINDYEKVATENNKQTILGSRKNEIFDAIYEKFKKDLYYEINENNFKKIDFDSDFTVKMTLDEIEKNSK